MPFALVVVYFWEPSALLLTLQLLVLLKLTPTIEIYQVLSIRVVQTIISLKSDQYSLAVIVSNIKQGKKPSNKGYYNPLYL
jgi:hypothetical protein